MTTVDQETALAAGDKLVADLIAGRPLSFDQRHGLARLLRTIKAAAAQTPHHDANVHRAAGAWDATVAEYDRSITGTRYRHGQDVVWRTADHELPVTVIEHHDDGWVEITDPGSGVGWTVPESELSLR